VSELIYGKWIHGMDYGKIQRDRKDKEILDLMTEMTTKEKSNA
jgi:hypothetical protein